MNALEEVAQQVDQMTDGLGRRIDLKIKRAVIAFNYAGFRTSMSCEGHLEVRGTPFPWIQVNDMNSLFLMEVMLKEFYHGREKTNMALRIIQYLDDYRVQSSDSRPHKDLVPLYERSPEFLANTQREMDEFAEFLMKKVEK